MQLIIYADDDEDDFFLFKKAVNELSDQYSVLHANCSVNLLDLIAAIQPSFIFLDIEMPGTNGIECLKLIRAVPKFDNIPIIIYSTSPHYKEVSFQNRANFYLVKPDSFAKIVTSLHAVLTTDWSQTTNSSRINPPSPSSENP